MGIDYSGSFDSWARIKSRPRLALLSFTEYGQKVIAEEEITPYDPSGYLNHLLSDVTNLDATVLFYGEEALGSFRANRYTAATVMLGVASERLFDILLESFISALRSSTERNQLEQKTRARSVSHRFDELKKRIEPKKSQLPNELRDNLDTYLVSVFNLIRYYRNDAGHPTGRAIGRDQSYANLYVFGQYCKYMYSLINHPKGNPPWPSCEQYAWGPSFVNGPTFSLAVLE